jgi:hypothetical protein
MYSFLWDTNDAESLRRWEAENSSDGNFKSLRSHSRSAFSLMTCIRGVHRISRIHRPRLQGVQVVARRLPPERRTGLTVVCAGVAQTTPGGDDHHSTGDIWRPNPRSVVRRMGAIVQFSIPVLLVPIADPLMSLIDVIFLGQFSTSLNVAGLSPATLIFNFLFCTAVIALPPVPSPAHS